MRNAPIHRGIRLLLAAAFLCAWTPVRALIVVDGKIVPAWPASPDSPSPSASQSPQVLSKGAAGAPVHVYPHPSGEVWGLTLLVDFSDTPPAFTPEDVDAWLNQKGFNRFGCNGSVRDYYADVSNGKVDFRNEIRGYYRAKNTKAYYEAASDYRRAEELVAELLEHFDPEIDFSKFDNDKDGKVEAISIVYAGKGLEWGRGLWPHAGGINRRSDGVQLTRYMMTDLGTSLSLYVFCHECGHMLFGWPDLYGFGDYCLMGNRPNDQNPVCINDFYRADQGWIEVVDVDASMNAYFTSAANGSVGYRFVNPARPQECFFWSNLANTGRRAVLKGRGLFVMHFDRDIRTNDPPKTLGLAVVQADGEDQLGKTMWPSPGSDARDYFSQATGGAFGASTTPAAKWNDGSASGLNLHGIGPAADTIGFYVGTGAVAVRPGKARASARAAGVSGKPASRAGRDVRGVHGMRAIGPLIAPEVAPPVP